MPRTNDQHHYGLVFATQIAAETRRGAGLASCALLRCIWLHAALHLKLILTVEQAVEHECRSDSACKDQTFAAGVLLEKTSKVRQLSQPLNTLAHPR